MPKENFDAKFDYRRYGALLWDYGRRKQDDGAISENEVSGNAMSEFGGPKVSRQPVPDYNNKDGTRRNSNVMLIVE
ncbi:hypothetical protein HAX54_014603 [Datura stramonium]|uniref:Uncharacterized protein n=1 Tax=Datura stramonium TaxID=4076 RepID=A0ABS8RZI5_DATST|nr:hypothetical protein [Datura stramonium]